MSLMYPKRSTTLNAPAENVETYAFAPVPPPPEKLKVAFVA